MILENNPNGSNVDISTLAKDDTLKDGTQKSQIVDLDGHVANVQNLQTSFAGDEYALVTQSIIHGKTTAGGGGYVDVKVSPSGAVQIGGTLDGNPNFSNYSSSSASLYDSSATTCTFTDNFQIVWSSDLGDTGNFIHNFSDEITLQPGETLTIAAISSGGNPSYVSASINTREDQ